MAAAEVMESMEEQLALSNWLFSEMPKRSEGSLFPIMHAGSAMILSSTVMIQAIGIPQPRLADDGIRFRASVAASGFQKKGLPR